MLWVSTKRTLQQGNTFVVFVRSILLVCKHESFERQPEVKKTSSFSVSQGNRQSTSMIVPEWIALKTIHLGKLWHTNEGHSWTRHICNTLEMSYHPFIHGLLTGYNYHQALAPKKIIAEKDNESCAVKTLLGWSVVGYSNSTTNNLAAVGIIHRTPVKELPLCSPRDLIKMLESDFAQWQWWRSFKRIYVFLSFLSTRR